MTWVSHPLRWSDHGRNGDCVIMQHSLYGNQIRELQH